MQGGEIAALPLQRAQEVQRLPRQATRCDHPQLRPLPKPRQLLLPDPPLRQRLPPSFGKSPFTSTINTGTCARSTSSASTVKNPVFPPPVIPTTTPCNVKSSTGTLSTRRFVPSKSRAAPRQLRSHRSSLPSRANDKRQYAGGPSPDPGSRREGGANVNFERSRDHNRYNSECEMNSGAAQRLPTTVKRSTRAGPRIRPPRLRHCVSRPHGTTRR